MTIINNLESFLAESIGQFNVPGASLAVLTNGEVHVAAAGFINTETKVETTTDSVFQIGSITKLLISTMVMQLVDEGKLELGAPVRRVLPDFAVGDDQTSAAVTARHLMSHSSGIDGDFFIDAGTGDDAVANLLLKGRSLPQLHPLGDGFSYCNYAFVVLARMIEVIDGVEWGVALRKRIAERLGTDYLDTRTEQLLRRRAAIGHAVGPDKSLVPVRTPFLPFAMGPAGGTPTCRAQDLISFAQAFLNEGKPLVSAESARAMRTPTTPTINAQAVTHFGLGFMLFDWNSEQLFGHDGATVAQNSYLRIHDSGTAVALLTNGGDVHGLAHHVMSQVFGELLKITPPEPLRGSNRVTDHSRYVGSYQHGFTRFDIEETENGLTLKSGPGEEWSRRISPRVGPFPLLSVDNEKFTYSIPGNALPTVVEFLNPDSNGHFTALHAAMRLNLLNR